MFGIQNYVCPLLFIKSSPGIFSNAFSDLCDPQQDLNLICLPNISIEIQRFCRGGTFHVSYYRVLTCLGHMFTFLKGKGCFMLNSSVGIIISEVVLCLVLPAFFDILSVIYKHAKNLRTGLY